MQSTRMMPVAVLEDDLLPASLPLAAASLPLLLPHHHRLVFVVASFATPHFCAGVIADLSRRLAERLAASLPTWIVIFLDDLWHHCQLEPRCSSLSSCGFISDLWLAAALPLLWDLAAHLTKQRETRTCLARFCASSRLLSRRATCGVLATPTMPWDLAACEIA